MYKNLLELIKLIFGPKALSKTIGTRTNVIQLPNNKIKRYIKEDLNIEAASDAAAMNAKKEMEELIPEIPKMNDAERLIFEGNLRRLKNKLGIRSETDPTAEVFEFGTKEKVTPGGIASLTEKAGQKSPPGTVMGNLESRLNRLRASGEDLGDIAKKEGGVKFSIPEKGIFNQELSADNLFDTIIKQQERFRKIQDSGLVTSTAREILQRDIKAGKLKLPKEIEDRIMLVDGNPGTVNPVEVFRTNYGEDALEQVDSLIPELAKAQSYSDLIKIVEKKYPMKPLAKPRKETMSLDEATKAEQENILTPKKPDEPEEFATGGRVGYSDGTKPSAAENTPSQEIINRMIAQIKQLSKRGVDVATIKDIVGASDQMIKDVLGKASGGRMSKGLDYLTGIERRGYAEGTSIDPIQSNLLDSDILYKKPIILDSSGGSDSSSTFNPTTSALGTNTGFKNFGGMIMGGILSAINPVLGMAYSLSDPNSITRQVLSKIGFNPTTEGSINGPFGGYNGFDGTEGTFSTDSSDTGASGGFDSAAEDSDQSGGDAGSTSGTDSAGDGGDGYATGGRVGFANGTYLEEDAARTTYDQILGQFLANRGDDPNFVHIVDPDISNILGVEAKDLWIPKHIAPFYEQKKQEYLSQQVPRSDLYSTTLSNTSPLQQHFDQNQLLKNAVASGQITPEQYNELGGYDVTQTMAGGNPVIGGIGNLIGSLGYNVVQSIAGDQPFSDIPGDVYRNVKGGLGFISPELKQTYQDIVQQRFPTYQQDLENYRQRQAAVDRNQVRQNYLQNLQNTGTTNVGEFQSKLQSNLMSNPNLANGGLVERTGFKFGTKLGRFWKIAKKVWDDINPTGDRKYDAQLVADELADKIFNKFMDELPRNVQIDLYALAYNNAPKVNVLFRNPQTLSEAAKKGMAASKEMESLGLDVTKSSDFFKYEEMKLSGQLGLEHQVQAYKDKIRDEFYGVIDDTLMKQVEVDDNPQRLAEVYASIKEGLEMQRKGMTPEEIVRVMKQTPRTKNADGGLNYLLGF